MFADALEDRVTGTDDVLASTAGTAPTYFIGGILTLFLMSYGPRLAQSAVDQLPDAATRRDIESVVTRSLRRSRRAILYTVALGVVIGVSVAGAAHAARRPRACRPRTGRRGDGRCCPTSVWCSGPSR